MRTEQQGKGSGNSGKPAESTVSKSKGATVASGNEAGASTDTDDGLSSAAMINSLVSEFGGNTGSEEAAGEEVQPGAESEAGSEGEESEAGSVKRDGERDDVAAGEEGEEQDQGEQEAAEEDAEADAGAEEGAEEGKAKSKLSPELEAALADAKAGKPVREIAKRIDAVVAQREEAKRIAAAAEQQLQSLRAEVAQLKSGKGQAAAGPVESMDEEGLDQFETNASRFHEMALNYLDDSASEEERAQVDRYMESNRLDAAGLKRRVRAIGNMLEKQVPQRRQQLAQFRQEEAAIEPFVKEHLPFLEDKSSKLFGYAQSMLQQFPEVRQRTPGWRAAMGVWALGMEAWEAKLAAKKSAAAAPAKPKAPVKAPPKLRPATAGAPKILPKEADNAAARERFSKTLSAVDAAKALSWDL